MRRRRAVLLAIALATTVPAGAGAAGAQTGADLAAAIARTAATAGAPLAVSRRRGTGRASFVRRADGGDLHPGLRGRAAADKAADFLARHGDLFGLADPRHATVVERVRRDPLGWTHVRWRQVHQGIEVFGAALAAHLAPAGDLKAVNGTALPIPGPLATTPVLPRAEAERIARVGARGDAVDVVDVRVLIYARGLLRGSADAEARLAWAVELEARATTRRELVMVDALDGRVLDRLELTPDALTRQVSQGSLDAVVWSEGDPDPIPAGWAGGTAAQLADWQNEIDGARDSYHFHGSLSRGGWIGFDGADAPMLTIHDRPGIGCPNAFWNGLTTNYCPGVTSDDVVSHEWGHAYTSHTNGLVYAWQPGALNESYSDVWGETIDLLNGRQTDAPGGARAADGSACSTFGTYVASLPATDASVRWLVAEDSTAFSSPIRDLWHPECRADPGRVGSVRYHCAESDSGGVHTNSGVPNHLYALLVDGGVSNGVTVPAIGLVKAANLHWRAQSVYETPLSDFADHADALEQSCLDLVGAPLGAPVVTPPATWTTATETITGADCAALAAAIAAVELRAAPPCQHAPILQPGAPPLCAGLGGVETLATHDFEGSLAPWTAGTRAVANPATYDGGTWLRTTALPDGRPGAAAFTADPIVGDCQADDESAVSYLESPSFVLPADRRTLRVAFTHWIATERGYDGGNVKVSVNGGPFALVPADRIGFNPYNLVLETDGNTAPTAGEPAWSGTDGGTLEGSWGESQLDLAGLVEPGDAVRLRFELGMDGCNGRIGWYVDDVRVHTCSAEATLCPAAPLAGCKEAPLGRAKLVVKAGATPARDRLQWSWSRGAATTLAEIGDPAAVTSYALCVWDWRGGTPKLASALQVPPGSAWRSSPRGARYADPRATVAGVSRIDAKSGVDRKAAAAWQAKGAAAALPAPASAGTRFAVEPRVTVQMVNGDGTCWTSAFGPADFRANTPAKTTALHAGP